jgi:hypothetical protein
MKKSKVFVNSQEWMSSLESAFLSIKSISTGKTLRFPKAKVLSNKLTSEERIFIGKLAQCSGELEMSYEDMSKFKELVERR